MQQRPCHVAVLALEPLKVVDIQVEVHKIRVVVVTDVVLDVHVKGEQKYGKLGKGEPSSLRSEPHHGDFRPARRRGFRRF